jgi:hypothetical protein
MDRPGFETQHVPKFFFSQNVESRFWDTQCSVPLDMDSLTQDKTALA